MPVRRAVWQCGFAVIHAGVEDAWNGVAHGQCGVAAGDVADRVADVNGVGACISFGHAGNGVNGIPRPRDVVAVFAPLIGDRRTA